MRDLRGSEKFTSADLRKIQKPVVEKRRRMRINQSLDQLKALVLGAAQQDFLTSGPRDAKLEKAEILEMTVKYLRTLQRRQLHVAAGRDPAVGVKYRSGFSECAQEVAQYVSKVDGLSSDVRMRLMNHLGQCVHNMSNSMATGHMPGIPAHAPMQVPVASALSALPGSPAFMANQAGPAQHMQNQNRNFAPYSASPVALNVMLGNGQFMPCYFPGVQVFGQPQGHPIAPEKTVVKEELLSPQSQTSDNTYCTENSQLEDLEDTKSEHSSKKQNPKKSVKSKAVNESNSQSNIDKDFSIVENESVGDNESIDDNDSLSDHQSNVGSINDPKDKCKEVVDIAHAHAPDDDESMWRPW